MEGYKAFALGAVERMVKTVAQVLLGLLLADGVASIVDVNAGQALGVAGLAAAVSLLTSIVSAPFGPGGSPSAVPDRPADPLP